MEEDQKFSLFSSFFFLLQSGPAYVVKTLISTLEVEIIENKQKEKKSVVETL
jgi:hypothetical protein